MIAHVCERALASGAAEVVVAFDDVRIGEAVRDLPVIPLMTRPDHASGTERLAEVAERRGWSDHEKVVNLQGDEPLIEPRLLRRLAGALVGPEDAGATLATPTRTRSEIFDANAVKVVVDRYGRALYFSRAPVPWDREGFGRQPPEPTGDFPYLRHIGLYAYTAGFLRRYASWGRSPLEEVESLEQLRILWFGGRITVLTVDEAPAPGVDTAADLIRVEQLLRART